MAIEEMPSLKKDEAVSSMRLLLPMIILEVGLQLHFEWRLWGPGGAVVPWQGVKR